MLGISPGLKARDSDAPRFRTCTHARLLPRLDSVAESRASPSLSVELAGALAPPNPSKAPCEGGLILGRARMQGFSPGLILTRNHTQVYAQVFPWPPKTPPPEGSFRTCARVQSFPGSIPARNRTQVYRYGQPRFDSKVESHARVHRFKIAERPRVIGGRRL